MEAINEYPFKRDPEEYKQGLLFPENVFNLLTKDHFFMFTKIYFKRRGKGI